MKGIACCGNDCTQCHRYVATNSGDHQKLADVAFRWYQYGFHDEIRPPGEMRCTGCSPDASCHYGIVRCAEQMKVSHCGKCKEYTCVRLEDAFGKTRSAAAYCEKLCSPDEYERLHRAFFSKKENLEKTRAE
jgi:hypothetical protein